MNNPKKRATQGTEGEERKKQYKALHCSTVKLPPSNSIIVYIPSSSIEEDQLYVMGVL